MSENPRLGPIAQYGWMTAWIPMIRHVLAAALLFAGVCGFSTAAHAASDAATAKTVIVRPASFVTVQDLEFGNIIAGRTAGTVVVPPTGVRSATGGVSLVSPTDFAPARFAGQGSPGQLVSISVSSTSVNLTRIGGTQTMRIDTFVIGSSPTVILGTAPTVFVIGSSTGVFNFPVGATLRVGANQAEGSYQGSFAISFNYL